MRAILFDFGGTLDCPRHWLDRFLGHYHAAGLKLSRAELDPAFTAATLAAYRAGKSMWNYGLRELIEVLVDKQCGFLGEQKVKASWFPEEADERLTLAEIKQRISNSFVEESEAGLARSRAVLSTLSKEFVIGAVSNFYGNLDRVLGDSGFGGCISAIADSGRLGIYKPDVAIYESALKMIGVDAAATVMVGDSIDKDCAPARGVGMQTVLLRHPQASSAKSISAAFTIDALEELEGLLCRMD